MKFPGYPSNREADERAPCHCRKVGRRPSRTKLSRETCLRMVHFWGWVVAAGRWSAFFVVLPDPGGIFSCSSLFSNILKGAYP